MQISSRLRKLILVFLGFLIMLFGKLVEEAGTFRSLSRAKWSFASGRGPLGPLAEADRSIGPVLAEQISDLRPRLCLASRSPRTCFFQLQLILPVRFFFHLRRLRSPSRKSRIDHSFQYYEL